MKHPLCQPITPVRHSFSLMLLVLLCLATNARSQAYVKTKDGSEYYGTIVHDSSDYVTIRGRDSSDIKIARDKIDVIERLAGNERSVKSSYPVIGFSIGTPSVFQAMIGYYSDGLGIRAGGGYFGVTHNGVQINILKSPQEQERFYKRPFDCCRTP